MSQTDSSDLQPEPAYKKWVGWATAFSLVFVPLAATGLSSYLAYKDAKDKNAAEYIKLGVSILSQKPNESNKSTRDWAIALINNYAPVKMSTDARKELSDTSVLSLSATYDLLGIKPNKTEHIFQWLGDYKAYDFELQKFEQDSWEQLTGMTVLGNYVSIEIPLGIKLRWRARGVKEDGTYEHFDWQNLIYKN